MDSNNFAALNESESNLFYLADDQYLQNNVRSKDCVQKILKVLYIFIALEIFISAVVSQII